MATEHQPMKVIRFDDGSGKVRHGVPVAGGAARLIRGAMHQNFEVTDETAPVHRLLAPIEPVDIIAIGLNYRRHAAESGASLPEEPLIFSKLTSTVIAPGEPIRLPASAPDEVDYEAELGVIIGRTARNVSEADALHYVLGYTCANDVSARDCQRSRDRQWTRAKSFDTFCPLGPCLLIDPKLDPNALAIRARLNDRQVQSSSTADMIFNVPFLISFLSHQFTLRPYTLILTGTPEGVGMGHKPPRFLQAGDTITIEVEHIGELKNPVEGK